MSKYTRANRVRSLILYYSASVEDATNQAFAVLDNHCAQDDIYIIGVHGMVELASSLNEATGEESITAIVSRASVACAPGELICISNVRQEEATAGAHEHNFLCVHDSIMFPEGCGMELDEGEYLNLIVAYQITKARIVKAWFEVYYVEK